MSYTIHHTPGIVIGIANRDEANRVVTIFTRELGLIRAQAQGIRKQESKLRFSTQQLSFVHCDVVLGKELWRLIGVESLSVGTELLLYPELWNAWNRCATLLARLLPFDEVNEELYEAVYDAYQFSLIHSATIEPLSFEHFLVLRILAHLGYWSVGDDEERELLYKPLTKELFDKKQTFLVSYTQAINNALRASDL